MRFQNRIVRAGGALSVAASLCAGNCSAPRSSAPAAASATAPRAPVLWGNISPVVSVKELMRYLIDPASDFVFDAVRTDITATGTVDTAPVSEGDWERVRTGAVMIAEGADLLRIARPFAPPGDQNNSTGPDAEELSPAQIKAKLDADPVLWDAKVQALRNVGLQVLEIAKRKNAQELWDAGDNLDQACENCHLAYWYPAEIEFRKKLHQRLLDLDGRTSSSVPRGR